MGRYVTPLGGEGGAGMRNLRMILTASNPAVPVPSWAKMVRVTGIGGGSGGSVYAEVEGGGISGGGCGGIAFGAVLPLGSAATIDVVIGAGGTGHAAGSTGQGGAGGDTTITAGGAVMILGGAGKFGVGYGHGVARMGSITPYFYGANYAGDSGLGNGYASAAGANGSPSPFGAGGETKYTGASNGENATGYGAGGGGSHGGKGGDGSPGIVILEFQEAVV